MQLFPLIDGHQHFAGLRSGIGADDAVLGHKIDESRGASVADAERALEQRAAAAAFADHDVDGRFVELVAFAQLFHQSAVAVVRAFHLHVDKLGDEVLLAAAAAAVDQPSDLVVAQVSALSAEQGARARPEKQHVAVAEQFVGAHFVEHHAAIDAAGDLERDAGRQVRLDQTGDHVDGRFLRGQDQVDADRAALLGQADDVLFDFLSGGHHHVGDFVGHDDDERQLFGNRRPGGVVFGLQAAPQFLLAQLVVVADVADAGAGEQRVALLHLFHTPRQDRFGLLHVRDDRMHEMGQAAVSAELNHLRVDHDHPHLVGAAGHQDRRDDGVQTDAFAGASAARDEQVGQGGQVDSQRVARDVLSEEQRDPHLLDFAVGLLDHFAEPHDLPFLVRNFDADGVLARDRRDDPHAGHPQRDRQIVRQRGNLRKPQPSLQFDLVLGDHWPGLDLDDPYLEPKVGERFFEHLRLAANLFLLALPVDVLAGDQQVDPGKFVVIHSGGAFVFLQFGQDRRAGVMGRPRFEMRSWRRIRGARRRGVLCFDIALALRVASSRLAVGMAIQLGIDLSIRGASPRTPRVARAAASGATTGPRVARARRVARAVVTTNSATVIVIVIDTIAVAVGAVARFKVSGIVGVAVGDVLAAATDRQDRRGRILVMAEARRACLP